VIIDAHCHLPAVGDAGTYGQAKAKLLDDLKTDGVDYAFVIPDNVPSSAIGDVETCIALLEDEPRLFLLGTIDIESQGREWVRSLQQRVKARRLVGMKIFPGHDPIYPTDPRLWPVYELCESFHVPMVIHTGQNPGAPEVAKFNHPAEIIEVASNFPTLAIIIAHFFCATNLHIRSPKFITIYQDWPITRSSRHPDWTSYAPYFGERLLITPPGWFSALTMRCVTAENTSNSSRDWPCQPQCRTAFSGGTLLSSSTYRSTARAEAKHRSA
jgi:hypothetical protein